MKLEKPRVFKLPRDERAPAGSDRIVVRKVSDGEYHLDVALIVAGRIERLERSPFSSEADALSAALDWAMKFHPGILYVERR
jgi:hypothetical protein